MKSIPTTRVKLKVHTYTCSCTFLGKSKSKSKRKVKSYLILITRVALLIRLLSGKNKIDRFHFSDLSGPAQIKIKTKSYTKSGLTFFTACRSNTHGIHFSTLFLKVKVKVLVFSFSFLK